NHLPRPDHAVCPGDRPLELLGSVENPTSPFPPRDRAARGHRGDVPVTELRGDPRWISASRFCSEFDKSGPAAGTSGHVVDTALLRESAAGGWASLFDRVTGRSPGCGCPASSRNGGQPTVTLGIELAAWPATSRGLPA